MKVQVKISPSLQKWQQNFFSLKCSFGSRYGGDSSRAASNLGQVLRGLGNMVGPDAQGIDTDVISGIFGMIGNSLDPEKKDKEGVDILSMISTVTGVLNQPGNAES
ncbi:hypothetical protein WA026_022580 [Henosepilachna vigintioctopunctata]|uniref:Uncharacterized protein n=1 Tax=Henosepilachna vigintioctopunctata TaxID=420089 RepID=A0AAW1VB34_9CUCU